MQIIVNGLNNTNPLKADLILNLNRHKSDTEEMQERWKKIIDMCKYDISLIPVDEIQLLVNYKQSVG